jgi:hypothetical protein
MLGQKRRFRIPLPLLALDDRREELLDVLEGAVDAISVNWWYRRSQLVSTIEKKYIQWRESHFKAEAE